MLYPGKHELIVETGAGTYHVNLKILALMKISCIAVDDEPLALEVIEDYIKKVPFLTLLKVFDNAIDAMEFLRNEKV